MPTKMTLTIAYGLPDPDAVGASEYRALYELLEDVADSAAYDSESPSEMMCLALTEVEAWARRMHVILNPAYLAPGMICPDCGSAPGVDETDHESDCPRAAITAARTEAYTAEIFKRWNAYPEMETLLRRLEQRLTVAARAFYVDGKRSALEKAFDGWRADAELTRAILAVIDGESIGVDTEPEITHMAVGNGTACGIVALRSPHLRAVDCADCQSTAEYRSAARALLSSLDQEKP